MKKYVIAFILLLLLFYPFPLKKGTSDKKLENTFTVMKLPAEIEKRVLAYSSDVESCTEKLETLRYITILYINFDGETKKGEMVADYRIAEDLKEIFEALYKNKYPLEKVELVDRYKGSDDASMKDNNTSAFNFRYIAGTNRLSMHAEGLAVDINPLYNPQVMESGKVYPEEGRPYMDREEINPHMIDHSDLAYQLFTKYGFSWGGDWDRNKDYQHFEKEIN